MDFFTHQQNARRRTAYIVLLFIVAVAGTVLAIGAVAGVVWRLVTDEALQRGLARSGTATFLGIPVSVMLWGMGVALATILGRTIWTTLKLASGGAAVAEMAGGRRISRDTADLSERKLLNVIDEMSIASGTAVPTAYVLDRETAINAFTAGFSPNEAVIAVTQGALTNLNRAELQGVIGHEFSHILNGDMSLNVQTLGVLSGLVSIGAFGIFLLRLSARVEDSRGTLMAAVAGALLAVVGYTGVFGARVIKAAMSRQREFLADASAVQFTRDVEGIGGALAKIGTSSGLIQHREAEALSHMFFCGPVRIFLSRLLATHPPIEERLRRLRSWSWQTGEMGAGKRGPAVLMERASGGLWTAAGPGRAGESMAIAPHAVVESVGNPSDFHVRYAAVTMENLPPQVREALTTPMGAKAVVYGLILDASGPTEAGQVQLLIEAGDGDPARRAAALAPLLRGLGRRYLVALIHLAVPALKESSTRERGAFLANLHKMIHADREVSLEEFVLLSMVKTRLWERAARSRRVRYRRVAEVDGDAAVLLSLLAHAGAAGLGDARTAFAKGRLQLKGEVKTGLLPGGALDFHKVDAALGRLRVLTPVLKRAVVLACAETVIWDGKISIPEAELLCAVAVALDCPLPPILNRVPLAP